MDFTLSIIEVVIEKYTATYIFSLHSATIKWGSWAQV